METEAKQEKGNVHQGRNVSRLRQSKGMKQAALAASMGVTQQAISQLEQKKVIDREMLIKVAELLNVPVEVLENMEEEAAIVYYIENNTIESVVGNAGIAGENTYNNNSPFDEIKRLYDEKEELYKAQLKDKQAEIDFLKKLLEGRKG